MAGILPPDHIEHYKRQVDLKTENLRIETINYIKNFRTVHNCLPCFPWTFGITYQTLRLLSDTIGHKNLMLDNLPIVVEHGLFQIFGPLPSGYVPKNIAKNVPGGLLPFQLRNGKLEVEATMFRQQMFAYIYLHFRINHQFPPIPHSFIVGFKYLLVKRSLAPNQTSYPLDSLPHELSFDIQRAIGFIPNGYIPGTTTRFTN